MKKYQFAVVGATGLVGRTMLQVLAEYDLPMSGLRLFASVRSAGREIEFQGKKYVVEDLSRSDFRGIDIALFSAGASRSKEFAPKFVEAGALVIDNSSAFRKDPKIPLVVPEVNSQVLTKGKREIIANPNCSTIQLVVPLKPLHDHYGIDRLVVATYQSVSGSGQKGVHQLELERQGKPVPEPFYPYQIDLNCIPWIGGYCESGYSEEEEKVMNETRKILGDYSIKVSCTAVRIPVMICHSEAVNISLKKPFMLAEVHDLLAHFPGVKVIDDPKKNQYPIPLMAAGQDMSYVGRIRKDPSQENGLDMWVVGDNLRKGAASNAVQIAEMWIKKDNG